MFVVYGLILVLVFLFIWALVKGPDYMTDDAVDVDENDLLTSAGRDGWDDNSVHSEGDF